MNKEREQKIIDRLSRILFTLATKDICGSDTPLEDLYKILCPDRRRSVLGKYSLTDHLYQMLEGLGDWRLPINLNTVADMYIRYIIETDIRYAYRRYNHPKHHEYLTSVESAVCRYRAIKAEITQSTRKPSRGHTSNL